MDILVNSKVPREFSRCRNISPQKLNKSIDQIDITNDYEFKYLEQIELMS